MKVWHACNIFSRSAYYQVLHHDPRAYDMNIESRQPDWNGVNVQEYH